MKLSELIGKEIVNFYDGARLGTVNESDLVIDSLSGQVESILLPGRGGLISLLGKKGPVVIPWQAVCKIGSEVIVVDLEWGQRRRGYLF
jgi:YlmC/YmxH family sporulation protein